MNSVEKYIIDNYYKFVENAGYVIYHVEFLKSHKDSILRIYIEPKDEIQTMDIDACEIVSRALSDAFDDDEHFPIPNAYIFEVSSPGIERILFVPAHYKRYIGEKIHLGLYKSWQKKKELTAVLTNADEKGIQIDYNGDTISFEYKDISKAQLYCDF